MKNSVLQFNKSIYHLLLGMVLISSISVILKSVCCVSVIIIIYSHVLYIVDKWMTDIQVKELACYQMTSNFRI